MPYKNPEDAKAYQRQHYQANRPAIDAKNRAWAAANKTKAAEHNASWKARNPDRARAYARKASRKKNGVLDATGEERFGKCPLCPYEGVLVCDHCKTTGLTRGWLCSRCNGALGKLGDTVEGLQRALDYVTAARSAHANDASAAPPEPASDTPAQESLQPPRRSVA
jgi:hypothetical protein